MSAFSQLTKAPDDPILGLTVAFREDAREQKVNLGVGAYQTADGDPLVLRAVRKAESRVLEANLNKEYQPIDGTKDFQAYTQQLVFGKGSDILNSGRAITAQTIGGSGALSIAGQFLMLAGRLDCYVSTPTWANHEPLLGNSGMRISNYPYYNTQTHGLDFDALCAQIPKLAPGAILFHAGCHNPTGVDPSIEQWKELSQLLKQADILPVFDMAYQGFGVGIEEDAEPIRIFARDGHEMLVCSSYSKNFGLYGERVGALTVLSNDADRADTIRSQLKRIIRSNYSTPPLHGGRLVSTVLGNAELKAEWKEQVTMMRERITEMRKALVSGLMAKGSPVDFGFMGMQKGMFSFSGLEPEQCQLLRDQFGIYMPKSGRINVAGLNPGNMDYVVESILSVLKQEVSSSS